MVVIESETESDLHGVEMTSNRPYGDNDIKVNAMMAGDKRRLVEVEHESDLCFGSISSHLAPYICYERLIDYLTVNSLKHGKIPPKKGGSTMKKFKSNTRHSVITSEHLARKMNIGLEKTKQINMAKTWKVIRNSVHPVIREYIVDHLYLHTAILA